MIPFSHCSNFGFILLLFYCFVSWNWFFPLLLLFIVVGWVWLQHGRYSNWNQICLFRTTRQWKLPCRQRIGGLYHCLRHQYQLWTLQLLFEIQSRWRFWFWNLDPSGKYGWCRWRPTSDGVRWRPQGSQPGSGPIGLWSLWRSCDLHSDWLGVRWKTWVSLICSTGELNLGKLAIFCVILALCVNDCLVSSSTHVGETPTTLFY